MSHLEKPCKDHWSATSHGYHIIHVPGTTSSVVRLHRYLYEQHHKVKLDPKDVIRHTCDNRWCIEITHLLIGTKKDNTRDGIERGRIKLKGEDNPNARLTEEDVKKIRQMHKTGKYTQAELAEEYDVYPSTISRIISRELWGDL